MSEPESLPARNDARVDSPAPVALPQVDRLLRRLVASERASVSLIEALAPPVAFHELFAFYRDSGFLYPGKLAAVDHRRDAVERTWRVLLGADRSVFRFISRLALGEGRPRLVNAICAFAYAPGTWQAQHLVSLQRREYTGTLALLLALSEWGHDIGIEFARFSFRPNNPGTNALFGGIAERLPSDLASLSLVDYGLTNLRDIDLPGGRDCPVAVRSLGSDEGALAAAFYERVLDPVELDSLRLAQPGLHELDAAYAVHGLTRRRTILVARDGDRVVGACIVNHSSEGINFSFLENAIEYLRVAPDQPALTRRATWLSLAGAAVAEVARTRDYVVCLTHPGDRDLATAAGLVPADPKQYAVLTVAMPEGFASMTDCFTDYYCVLLSAEVTLQEAR